MSDFPQQHGLLKGIRVLEWGALQIVPQAGTFLAALGADVIKIEHPTHGDYSRGLRRVAGGALSNIDSRGENIMFTALNRNKRSVTIDLGNARGRDVMMQLTDKSDVFLCGFRQSAARALGVDAETLTRHNQQLVYILVSAFGRMGPDRDSPGVDLTGLARAGALFAQGDFATNTTALLGVGDSAAASHAAFAAVGGLLHRHRTGSGQVVSVSLLGSTFFLFLTRAAIKFGSDADFPVVDRSDVYNPLYNVYKAMDGKWICLAMAFQSDRDWPKLCQALGASELARDARFVALESRGRNSKQLIGLLDSIFASRDASEWLAILAEHGISATGLSNFDDLQTDPQFAENGYIVKDPETGTNMLGFPIEFTASPAHPIGRAPELGEHTEQVLQEVCGVGWDDMESLRSAGAFGSRDLDVRKEGG